MPYEHIVYEKSDRIAYITLNRPQSLNALSRPMIDDLNDAFRDFDADPDVWVAILSGNGRSFCAGADTKMMGKTTKTESNPTIRLLDNPINWKPVIAAVHGHAYGYGLSLVSESDLVVATVDAQLCLIETRHGMPPVEIAAHMWAWMNSKVLTEMIVTADPLSGSDAYRLGMVNALVSSQEELLPAAERLARRILQNPPSAVRAAIQLARKSASETQICRDAASIFRNARWAGAADYTEAMAARREKRPPQFTGR